VYISALFEALKRVNDYRSTGKLQKLLGSTVTHPRTLPGSGDDRNVHKDSEK
jgi:hypothetical protein